MAKPEKTARKPTTAERLAARALGREMPEVIEVDTTSTGARHLERVRSRQAGPGKPKGMPTGEWYHARYDARSGEEGDPPDAA